MKAWNLHGPGDIRFEEVSEPKVSPGRVTVAVKAAGICGSDIPRIFVNGAHRHPLIPGHEFSGQVVEACEAEAAWKGKRVGVFPLIPCMSCAPCKAGRYEMCQSYDYLGSRSDGGFAEYVSVPVWNLIELPDSVSFETAAMLEPTAVAAHAMRRIVEGGSSPGSDSPVAVCGLGTIGLLLIMLLKQRGFSNVYAIGKRAAQQQRAAKLGVDGQHYLDATDPDTPGKLRALGIEAFWECVGSRDTYAMAIDVTAPLGQVMLVGNPHSDMDLDRDVYWKILRNQLTVYGTWNSSYGTEKDDWKYVLGLMERGVIDPEVLISHRLPLEGLMEGLVIMRDKTEDYCKVMVSF